MISFALQKLFILMWSHLFIFHFVTSHFAVRSKKSSPRLMSRNWLHIFSSRDFKVQVLMFNSLIHFELIGVSVNGPISFFYIWLSSSPDTIYGRDHPFSTVHSCLCCHKLTDPCIHDLLLGSLFCSIDLYICFCVNAILFWWL